MKKYFTLLLFFFVAGYELIFAINDNPPGGAQSAGMADASVMWSGLWGCYHNQAGLADVENISAGFHFKNAFGIKQLSTKSFAFAVPTKTGTFGLSYSYFGYSQYNESKAGIAFGKQLWDFLSLGVQVDYLMFNIGEDYGKAGMAVAEIGLQAQPVENLFLGAHVFNPTLTQLPTYDKEEIPTVFRGGIGYKFSDKVLLSIEAQQEIEQETVFKSGIEYQPVENLFFRAGISTNPTRNTFGMGYIFKKFRADLAFSLHQTLGYTTRISIGYHF